MAGSGVASCLPALCIYSRHTLGAKINSYNNPLRKEGSQKMQQLENIKISPLHQQANIPHGSMLYKCKVITAGNKQQFFNYTKPQLRDYTSLRVSYEKSMDSDKRDDSLQRTRNQMILLIDSNVTPYSKFITLTFAKAVLDRKEAFAKFKQFSKDFKRLFGYPLKYVLVIEHQKKRGLKEGNEGSLHFHLVVFNERKLPFKDLKSIWGKYGSIDVKKIDYSHNLGVYMAKYLSKEVMEINKKGYTSSKELIHPTIEYLPLNYSPERFADYQTTYSLYNPDDENTINICSFKEYHHIERKPRDIKTIAIEYFGAEKVIHS
jgi:hypothetical protein